MLIFKNFIQKYRENRRLLLLIVYVALFLDNMLLTTVVPIIPEYLLRISHPNSTDMLLHDKITVNNINYNKTLQNQVATNFLTTAPQFIQIAKKRYALYNNSSFKLKKEKFINWDSDVWNIIASTKKFGRINNTQKKRMQVLKSTKSYIFNSYESLSDEFSIKNTKTSSTKNKLLNNFQNKNFEQNDVYKKHYINEQEKVRHQMLANENVDVGFMFGSKALIQLIANPLIGPLTNKIGYTVPMFAGFVIMFLSTLLFAFGSTYFTLWFARALQGVGSACTSTSGMGMLAQAYPNDAERGSAMGIALGGLALGVLIGPPYGGLLYQWAGKKLPFILLALLALCDGTFQLFVLQPKLDRGKQEGTAIKELIKDKYIIIAAGSITIGNLGIAMLEPSLPLWMMESWGANSIERGAAFLPASISYLIGTNVFGPLAHKIGRWLSGFIGLVLIGFCLLAIPSAKSVGGLIIPNFFMGFSIGMIDASMFPMMGYIVDVRHVGVYGSIYAIADAAFCFAFALGPFFSGSLVKIFGFPTMMYIIAVINFIYAPFMFFLKKLPENLPLTDDTSIIQNMRSIVTNNNLAQYDKIEGFVNPLPNISQLSKKSETYINNNLLQSNINYQCNLESVWDN